VGEELDRGIEDLLTAQGAACLTVARVGTGWLVDRPGLRPRSPSG
jgi:hypothetical protein